MNFAYQKQSISQIFNIHKTEFFAKCLEFKGVNAIKNIYFYNYLFIPFSDLFNAISETMLVKVLSKAHNSKKKVLFLMLFGLSNLKVCTKWFQL